MKIFYMIPLLIWMGSCNDQKSNSQEDPRDKLIAKDTVSGKQNNTNNQIKPSDTLIINNKAYYLESISEDVFNALPDQNKIQAADPSLIKIYQDSISVKTEKEELIFKKDTNLSEKFAVYTYKNTYKDIGFVQIHFDGWESHGELLISLKTGEKKYMWGEIKASPDNTKFISYNVDMWAGYTPNGFQLVNVNNGALTSIFEVTTENWGPEEIKWENNSTIVIKRLVIDFANDYKEVYDYKRMKINL